MKSYLASQFGNPKGILGPTLGIVMSITNREKDDWTISLLNVQPSERIGIKIKLLLKECLPN